MNKTEWMETWQRLKARFPSWQPSEVEAEDWCRGLRVYKKDMVEDVSRWIKGNYSSNTPAMKWFINECEKRKRDLTAKNQQEVATKGESREEYESKKEATLQKLEDTDIDSLRTACRSVMNKYPFVAKPTCGNPREWKSTLRSMVFLEIYGDETT